MILHAGFVARRLNGLWRGVLIEGPSGIGKSDLALRALEAGFRLVADDHVIVFSSGDRLYGRAPPALRGLIEARGVGLARREPVPYARIDLRVSCATRTDAIERLPDPICAPLLGIELPSIALWPFEPSAAVKLGEALERLGARA